MPRIIAYRGASATAPENTRAAIEAATSADVVHVDLRLTADRHVVAIHDATVDATTTGTGEVARLDLAAIRAVDAGSWFAERFAGQRVPMLEEVLDAVRTPLLAHLHGTWSGLEAALVAAAVADAGLTDQVTVISGDPAVLDAAAAAGLDRRALLLHRADPGVVERCVGWGLREVALPGRVLVQHPGLVERFAAAGLAVTAWALGEPATWAIAAGLGVDAIATPDPAGLARWAGVLRRAA